MALQLGSHRETQRAMRGQLQYVQNEAPLLVQFCCTRCVESRMPVSYTSYVVERETWIRCFIRYCTNKFMRGKTRLKRDLRRSPDSLWQKRNKQPWKWSVHLSQSRQLQIRDHLKLKEGRVGHSKQILEFPRRESVNFKHLPALNDRKQLKTMAVK